MIERFRIAAYTRISVDVEQDRDNTSIENQKAIIGEYCKLHFPTSTVDYFEDRDRSGYTFEQREGYAKMRPLLLAHQYDILIVKDLSRFSRRTGKGLAEFEDLIELGLRIIAIGDGVDYPTNDDLMKIKLYFFVNEMPVTDASNKVNSVIANRQQKGEWICSVPYGYVMTNSKRMQFEVDEPAAEVVREIFRLYIDGWGYKKIANRLTDMHIPTPRMREKARREAAGDSYRATVKETWSIVTVSEILCNDFYIGTLRQHKYRRKKINGQDEALDESEHFVFEDHHESIVDFRTFAIAKEQLKKRSTSSYRGQKKYDNNYSGFLFCGDCGSPMFAMSRKDLAEAYTCGTYHVRGRAGCTSHHIRVDVLDEVLKNYIRRVRDGSGAMLKLLGEALNAEPQQAAGSVDAIASLERQIEEEKEQLKIIMRQKARDLMRAGDNAEIMEQTYDALIEETGNRIVGLENQLRLTADRRNAVICVNRVSRTVVELFDDILNKNKLDKRDLHLLLDRIIVYEDHIEVRLRSDVDELLRTGFVREREENAVNFNFGREDNEKNTDPLRSVVVQSAAKRADKVFSVNVICNGSPSRIRMVLRISLGITTRPRSSILRTIPVAFIRASNGKLIGLHLLLVLIPRFIRKNPWKKYPKIRQNAGSENNGRLFLVIPVFCFFLQPTHYRQSKYIYG